jgi:hypothetical protein
MYNEMIGDYVSHWRQVYRMLNYRPAVVAERDFVGVDMELAVVTSDDYAGTRYSSQPIPGHSFILRLVDGVWLIRAQSRRLPYSGWPPTEEEIPGLKIDGNR